MSVVSKIINGLTSLFQNLAKGSSNGTPKHIGGIAHKTLQRVFQFNNDDVFSISENAPLTNDEIQLSALYYEKIGSPVADHLLDKALTKVDYTSQFCRDDESCFIFIDYTRTDDKDFKTKWASFQLIGPHPHDPDSQILHFWMAGEYHTQANQSLVLIPRDVGCLINVDGDLKCHIPECTAELQCLFAYANQAFLQLLRDEPIDVESNQKWVTDGKFEEAAKLCEQLRERTATSLNTELKKEFV